MTTRVYPPSSPLSGTTAYINKAVYYAVPGMHLDVPDADAQFLAAQGWLVVGAVGPTRSRENTVLSTMQVCIDTSLSRVLFWDGLAYRDVLNDKIY